MKPQTKSTSQKALKNVKRGIYIKYRLAQKDYTMTDIAKDLNISLSAVSRAIYCLSTVSRVDNWLKENLDI